ncbi:MAG: hypothetical protein M3Y26_08765 [Actinomycetota bacterium]|nr:hypothetical protein [Actinomycetota bacterium]
MATNSDPKAKFSLVFDDQISTSAKQAGDSIESLRQRIAGGEDAVKNMRAAFNRLRGSTDDVKAAKAELTAKLNAERAAISSASLKLLSSGTTYDAVATKAKKLAQEQEALKKSTDADKAKAMGSAFGAAGGPVAALRDRLQGLKDIAGGAGGKLGLLTFAAVGLVAAAAAVVAAVAAAAYSLGKWIIESANSARSANLLREAWSGTAKNAGNLGTQVDALAAKVPTSKDKINELAIALMKTKLGGQTTVDTLNAVGHASAALGDEAGNKIKEFVERGRLLGRFRLDPREMLEGFGDLKFDDVAKSLAAGMNVSVAAAKKALAEGRVKLGDGAKAMRDAVEAKFGDLNLRKMLDLNVMAEKFKERLANLTSGVNIDPLLKGLSRLSALFDTSSVTGAALKEAISAFGNIMVRTLAASMPFIEMFLKGMILGALDLGIGILKLRNSLRATFGDSKLLAGIDWMNVALSAGKTAVNVIGGAFLLLGAAVAIAVAPFVALFAVWQAGTELGKSMGTAIRKFFLDLDWAAVGRSIPEGLLTGLKMGGKFLFDGVSNLAEDTKKRFKLALGINSPSKVFRGYGEGTAEGYAQGVDRGAPEAARAIDAMVSTPSVGGGSSSSKTTISATSGGATVNFIYQAGPGGSGDAAAQVNESGVRAALVRILQEANINRGAPVAA